jgi:hypothetical protein
VSYRPGGRRPICATIKTLSDREPRHAASWVGLGELAVAGRDWATATAAADALAGLGADLPAAVLRARVLLGRREFGAARGVLAGAIGRHPADVRLRLLWSHLWLLAGTDPASAERALSDVLALDPGNAEARHNLAVLRADRGR